MRSSEQHRAALVAGRRAAARCLAAGLVAGLATGVAHAQNKAAPTEPVPRLSVAQWLSLADGTPYSPPAPDWSAAMTRRLAAESASLYIAGVLDGGEGKRWCVAASGVPPHEVDAQLIAAVRAEASPKSNAATAIAAALSKHYPCASKR